MTSQAARSRPQRRLRAILVEVGPDDPKGLKRVINGPNCLILGGDQTASNATLEMMLRLESELERCGRELGEIPPLELAEIAWRIDSPALHRMALRLDRDLRDRGQRFEDASAEELTGLILSAQSSEADRVSILPF